MFSTETEYLPFRIAGQEDKLVLCEELMNSKNKKEIDSQQKWQNMSYINKGVMF